MSRRAALSHTWVRATVVSVAVLVLVVAFYLLGATLLEDGHRSIGWSVLSFAMAGIFVTIFIGPGWVLAARTPGGGPRGSVHSPQP